ncbi:MAG: hypothetical protein HYU66_01730 [Armatimonadetes bacterium]|nr:hypothetical protein [Armatimonadota bacterium]
MVLAANVAAEPLPDRVARLLGAFPGRDPGLVTLYEAAPKPSLGKPEQAWNIVKLQAACVAGDRWLWRVEFAGQPNPRGETFILYANLDDSPDTGRQDKPEVRGTDIMYCFYGADGSENVAKSGLQRTGRARYLFEGNVLWICDDVPIAGDAATACCRVRLLSQKPGSGDGSDWIRVQLPRRAAEALPAIERPSGLSWHGLPGSRAEPAGQPLEFGRPRPAPPFSATGKLIRTASWEPEQLEVELLEDTGRARHGAPVCFGLPLPQGVVCQPAEVRISDRGQALPADVAVTSFWPDQTLRWVSVTVPVELAPRQRKGLTVELGREVSPHPPLGLRVDAGADRVLVDTGAVQVAVGLEPLRLEQIGAANALRGAAFVLHDVAGREYRLGRAALTREYVGAGKCILRLEAPYVDAAGKPWFRGVVRLTFTAGSPAIALAHTLIDDNLEWEFADFRSLSLDVALGGTGAVGARYAVGSDDGLPTLLDGRELAVPHDQAWRLDGTAHDGRTIGVCAASRGGAGVAVGVTDFWQRYPKAIAATGDGLQIQLFPALDGPASPGKLPDHLAFPFVEGMYRFKWGMSTTDRLVLVPHGAGGAAPALDAALDAVQPVIAVVPGSWYERTGALGEVVAAAGKLFAGWDQAFARAFDEHLRLKEAKREYGYFNWGDWHGERECNWGNNEYDLPHGLFLQFARTGRRDYYRLALAGARHQADVDCIHAYPDPFYLGGDLLHSYGHAGEWSESMKERSWSFAYGYHAAAFNGHTWADGLCDAWYLAADPVVMDAALGLGEHIAWQMSRRFTELGTHERSAGWSAHAIAALYRATLDTEYLAALKRIVEVAFREQKLDQGGAWPHVLPEDHAGGVPGAVGNVGFLIGVLLEGIDDYWAASGDPRAQQSINAAVGWMRTQWHPDCDTFQYTSSPGFAARVTRQGATLNDLMLGPMLRSALWTKDDGLAEIGARGFVGTVRNGFDGFGKSLAQAAHFGPQIMARLKALGAQDKPYGAGLSLSLDELRLADLLQTGGPQELFVRGPVDKVVYFRHPGGKVGFAAVRTAWGAMPKQEAEGTIRLVGPDGAVVKEGRFSTDAAPWRFDAALDDAPAGVYRVEIHDDLRSRWDVTGPAERVFRNDPPVQLGGPGPGRYWFMVPAGTAAFKLTITSHHGGQFGVMVRPPDGQPAVRLEKGEPDKSATLEVSVPAGAAGKLWSVVVYAKMDVSVRLEGLPPYLATSAEGWFSP